MVKRWLIGHLYSEAFVSDAADDDCVNSIDWGYLVVLFICGCKSHCPSASFLQIQLYLRMSLTLYLSKGRHLIPCCVVNICWSPVDVNKSWNQFIGITVTGFERKCSNLKVTRPMVRRCHWIVYMLLMLLCKTFFLLWEDFVEFHQNGFSAKVTVFSWSSAVSVLLFPFPMHIPYCNGTSEYNYSFLVLHRCSTVLHFILSI